MLCLRVFCAVAIRNSSYSLVGVFFATMKELPRPTHITINHTLLVPCHHDLAESAAESCALKGGVCLLTRALFPATEVVNALAHNNKSI